MAEEAPAEAGGWGVMDVLLAAPQTLVHGVYWLISLVFVIIPGLIGNVIAFVWTFFEAYGWYLVVAGVLAYMVWQQIGSKVKAAYKEATALPAVQADPDAVLRARQRQQEKAQEMSKKEKEFQEARRRAAALGQEKPVFQREPQPPVRRNYGGGGGGAGGDSGFRRGPRRDMRSCGGGG